MGFQKLSSNSKALLDALVNADNPTHELCARWDIAVGAEMDELKGIISELRQLGYINVKFADNKPYIVTLNNLARTYNEQLADYEASQKSTPIYYDHSVRIGDGNKITKSIIGSKDPLMNIISARVIVGVQCIADILATIENRLLDTLLLLEKEFGNLDDLDIDATQKSPEEIQNIVNQVYIIVYNDSSITIGDGNKINNSSISTSNE